MKSIYMQEFLSTYWASINIHMIAGQHFNIVTHQSQYDNDEARTARAVEESAAGAVWSFLHNPFTSSWIQEISKQTLQPGQWQLLLNM